ncbi:MAG: CUB domain-containing protein [Bacteroidia bacterium]|nr:fibronectin type III domain-containing protein [Bacteroidia bacterium]MDW8157324.1 CUB domain-containing protein [Bacteroidia bacterium]
MKQFSIPKYTLPTVNVQALLQEDVQRAQQGAPFRFGTLIPVRYNPSNAGNWVELENGNRVWRMQIEAPSAYSLSFLFNEFNLPHGASLYIFSQDRSHVLGAYTHANNAPDKKFSTEPLKGASAILEYYEPASVKGQGQIQLSAVVYGYRDIFFQSTPRTQAEGESQECNVNINCPVAARWQELQKAVCLIIVNSGTALCSGTLINTTRNDGTPYVLTHANCIEQGVADAIFLFNYQSPTCENDFSPRTFSLRGAQVLAINPETFVGLVELTDAPQNYIQVHYAPWDNGDNNPGTAFSIHHPAGDIKKFALTDRRVFPVGSIAWQKGAQTITTPVGAHWRVNGWQVGTIESSSIGAPLFNESGRIAGIISGFEPETPICPGYLNRCFVGKLAWAYYNGSNANFRLKEWLSPDGKIVENVNGLSLAPPPPACTPLTLLTAPSGEITDGSGNKTYNNNLDCSWVIKPAGAASISIRITELKTEQDYDFVEIYEGEGLGGTLLARFSGRTAPNYTIVSNTGVVTVRFVSDYIIVDEGFRLEYFSIPRACLTPQGLSAAPGSISAPVRWEPVAEVRRYEVNYKLANERDWSVLIATTNNYINLLQLLPGTEYQVRVRSVCTDSLASSWSLPIQFKTLSTAICNSPQTIVSLQSDALSATVFWNEIGNAYAYQISWRSNDGSPWLTTQYTEENSFILPNLQAGVEYEVRVRALCQREIGGEPSAWSSSYFFTMQCLQPEITSAVATGQRSARIEWRRINGVENYQIRWRLTSRSTWRQPLTLSTSTFELLGLEPGAEYEVQVRAICSKGILSDWSLPAFFQTNSPPSCSGIQIIYDAAGIIMDSPDSAALYSANADCRWLIQPPNAHSIRISFNWLDTERGFDFVEIYDGPTTDAPSLARLSGNTAPQGEWISSQGVVLVRFVTDGSIEGKGFSLNFSANTFQPCRPPATDLKILPASYSAEIRWSPTPNARRYQIAYKATDEEIWRGPFLTSDTVFYAVQLTPASRYQVRIRSICGADIVSPWSNIQQFTTNTLGTCTPPRLYAIASLDSIFVYWQHQPGVRTYEISYKPLTSRNWITLPAQERDTSLLSGFKYTWLSGLQPFVDYQIRARAYCLAGTVTPFSDEVRISTGRPHCSGTQILRAPSGRITDGSGIEPYSLGLNCQWLIQSTRPIQLNFVQFRTVEGDYVEIFDGETPNDSLLGRFSGSRLPNDGNILVTRSNSALIRFRTGFFEASEGFELIYRPALSAKQKNQTLTKEVYLYPNPTTQKLSVHLSALPPQQKGTLSIVDAIGRLAQSYELQSDDQGNVETTLEVSSLAPGIYTLQAAWQNQTYHAKFLKQ